MADLPEVGRPPRRYSTRSRATSIVTPRFLKNQPWRTTYLDGYTGGGRAVVRVGDRLDADDAGLFDGEPTIDFDARELIDGSPRVAIGIANPFARYVFADPDPDRAAELEALKQEFGGARTINAFKMTAAEAIAWVRAQSISRRTHRGVAFLDPFGAKLDWASIQKLANTGLFEVVVNLALGMAIQRMLPNSGEVPEGWAATIDSYFGSRAWFEEIYQRHDGGVFASNVFEKRPDYLERLLELNRARLRSAFGHVSIPRLIRNTRGAPLYYLLWAGPNRKGLEGAEYILTMVERLGRQGERAAR